MNSTKRLNQLYKQLAMVEATLTPSRKTCPERDRLIDTINLIEWNKDMKAIREKKVVV